MSFIKKNDDEKSFINREDFYMKKACNLANKSVLLGGGPFGCVITDDNYFIVGKGSNQVTLLNDPTLHAEIVAIRDACKKLKTFNLSGCTLYTSCEPCPMCLSAIYWSRINKVFYGNTRDDAKAIGFDDEFIYNEIGKNIDERQIEMVQCDENSAKKSFQLWCEKEDKIKY
jgi:tRNA(Arg) A34 adenosine deaminase TadA